MNSTAGLTIGAVRMIMLNHITGPNLAYADQLGGSQLLVGASSVVVDQDPSELFDSLVDRVRALRNAAVAANGRATSYGPYFALGLLTECGGEVPSPPPPRYALPCGGVEDECCCSFGGPRRRCLCAYREAPEDDSAKARCPQWCSRGRRCGGKGPPVKATAAPATAAAPPSRSSSGGRGTRGASGTFEQSNPLRKP